MEDFAAALAKSTSGFKITAPRSYYQYAQKLDTTNDLYFFQLKGLSSVYNLDFSIKFYAKSAEIVTTEGDVEVVKSTTGEEEVRFESVCQIRPTKGKFTCNYLLATDVVRDVNIRLVSFSRASTGTDENSEEHTQIQEDIGVKTLAQIIA